MISVITTSSAPLTACEISLWSTRMSFVWIGFRMSLFDRIPARVPSSSRTMRDGAARVAILRRISLTRASRPTEPKLRSTTRSMLEAVRTTRAVVAES